MESVAPIEVSSSSNVGRVDSGKDCVNTYLEDVVTTTDSTADIVTKEATTQVEAFHFDIMDIANLIHPAIEIILKEVASKVESKQPTPSNKGERVENIHSSGNSSKSKSSAKSGSQKKKKVKNHVSSPLICLGDFDVVRFSYEKLGGNATWNSSKELFNNMILNADLEDLSYTGCQFTWSNKRSEGAYITSKIDRAFADHPDFIQRVDEDQLVSAQIKLEKDPLNGVLQTHEKVAYAKYVDLSSVEERLAHQKSRVQWLGYGDRNSKFFFRTIKGNINKGRIQSVVAMILLGRSLTRRLLMLSILLNLTKPLALMAILLVFSKSLGRLWERRLW
ncbi:hypothetical protein CsSME_00051626 [Camellia sinensis var. sinensis]